jgi:hypothetical protein
MLPDERDEQYEETYGSGGGSVGPGGMQPKRSQRNGQRFEHAKRQRHNHQQHVKRIVWDGFGSARINK